jgi:1,4-alpha-glucan branching enzyme
LQYEPHKGIFEFIKALNNTYRTEQALYEKSFNHDGFEWIESGDARNSVLIYLRKGIHADNNLIIALNLTPIVLSNYRIGLPAAGTWKVILNSDQKIYYGSGIQQAPLKTENKKWMGQPFSAELTLPPLGGMVLKRIGNKK